MLTHKLYVFKGGAALGKARRGLDKLRTAVGHDFAEADFFLFRKQAALDDHLQQHIFAGFSDSSDIVGDILPAAVLHHGEVDHHIHLIRTVLHGISGFKSLGGCRHIPVREADYRADLQFVAHIALRSGNMTGRNANRRAVIFDGLIAERPDLFRCAVYAKKGMVTDGEDLVERDFLFGGQDFIDFVFVVHGNTFFH